MDLKIKGKKALVLGASSGIGRSVAQCLVQEGAQVAICSRDETRLQKTAELIGAQWIIPCDLSRPQGGKLAVQSAIQQMGNIDILVVNTGGPPKGKFEDLTSQIWLDSFQSLWMSAVDSIQAALPTMKNQRWGRILLVTSVAAKEPMFPLTISNGLRAGLLGLTKSICHEIAPYGVTINALLPGYTKTERLLELGIPEDKIVSQIPAGRLASPEEFAALAAFLASDQAGYITGQTIASDGGYLRGI